MAQYSELIEYLLAKRLPGSRYPLCRFGVNVHRIDTFPPNYSVTFQNYPQLGCYAAIEYWIAFSQAMVPDAFYYEAHQEGVEISGEIFSAGVLSHEFNFWMVLTQANPVTLTLTNRTPLVQYYEGGGTYLLIDTNNTFLEVLNIIDEWCNRKGVTNPVSASR